MKSNSSQVSVGDTVTIKGAKFSTGKYVVKSIKGNNETGTAEVVAKGSNSRGLLGFTNTKLVGQSLLEKEEE